MTRFGEISPHLTNFKAFGNLFKPLFRIWQNFEPALVNFRVVSLMLIVVPKLPNFEQII